MPEEHAGQAEELDPRRLVKSLARDERRRQQLGGEAGDVVERRD
jgi:hypothetical protein